MESQVLNCNNCGEQVSESYCPNCGQRTKVGELSYKDLGEDLSQSLFSLEAPIWLTTRMLFTQPGVLFRDYLKGSRKKYYKPVAFFILVTAFYIIIRSIIGFDDHLESFIHIDAEVDNLYSQAREFMLMNINKFLFLFVLGIGLFLKLFFYKQNRLVELWVIGFYTVGIYTLLTTFGTVFTIYSGNQIQSFVMLIFMIYFIYCCVKFFRGNVILKIIKSFFVFVLSMMLYITAGFALSYLIVSLV